MSVDESEYKSVRNELVAVPCVFEKSILALKTQCPKASKKNIAEREVVMCDLASSAERCDAWLTILRAKSQFSLHISERAPTVLPHAKEMKVQAGGMLGLCQLLGVEMSETYPVPNVFEVLEISGERFSDIESLPFAEIVREVAHFRAR